MPILHLANGKNSAKSNVSFIRADTESATQASVLSTLIFSEI